MKQYVMALDQGTTSSRAIIFDREQRIVATAQKEFRQIFPQPGWVEHDPLEIFDTQSAVMLEALHKGWVQPDEIAAVGITNQRETTILWDRHTGLPVYNAIVWQCRRTAALCEELKKIDGLEDYVRCSTGLRLDAYFSATKICWLLDHVPDAREKAENGDLLFGTVDTWLLWKLTGGRVHATDMTNAARTMLYNIRELDWDKRILKALDIPGCILPEVRCSSEIYGTTVLEGVEIPIAGMAGDQQSALFGQACLASGHAKNTYGTGCFLLMNTGKNIPQSHCGMLTTIGVSLPEDIQYALEGSVFTGGSVNQWLRDQMGLIDDAADTEYFASKVEDTNGVYIVPAFTGLGAPYWDMYARGVITGLTRGANRNHLIRAALESIAYQVKDLLDAITKDTGLALRSLKVDGGASANNLLMQFQADILGCSVCRPKILETTALGAACLAGLAVGFWRDRQELAGRWTLGRCFEPQMSELEKNAKLEGWQDAVRRCLL